MPTPEDLKTSQLRQWESNAAGWDGRHDSFREEAPQVSDWICREAGLVPGMRVLDLACGTGHPAIDAAQVVGTRGSVVATDFSPQMVEFTRRRVENLGIDNVECRVVDAEQIDFPDANFDAVTCRFGLMFCPRPDQAAAEAFRVLKPGGRFALSVWGDPINSPAQTVVAEALTRFGRPQPPFDFSVPGILQLAPSGKLEGVLKAAGFSEVRVEPLHVIWQFASLEAFWQRQLVRQGPLPAFVRDSSAQDVERLKAILAEIVEPYTEDGVVRLAVTPLCAVAAK